MWLPFGLVCFGLPDCVNGYLGSALACGRYSYLYQPYQLAKARV